MVIRGSVLAVHGDHRPVRIHYPGATPKICRDKAIITLTPYTIFLHNYSAEVSMTCNSSIIITMMSHEHGDLLLGDMWFLL
jgi:hypothetical protein